MIHLASSDLGALARRLRDVVGIGVRALAEELEVTHSAVARAERGDPALASLAARAVYHLLERLLDASEDRTPLTSSMVEEAGARFEGPAAEYLDRLLANERGWRRALVRGVFEEHGFEVETDGGRAVVSFIDEIGNQHALHFNLDRGTFELSGQRFRAVGTSPYGRADRESWGEALEFLAGLHAPRGIGWAERAGDVEATLAKWRINDGDDPSEDTHPLT